MEKKLIKDFNEKSYIYHLEQNQKIDSLLFNVQFTGYEEIGEKYHLLRGEFPSFMLTYTISGNSNIIYDGKYYKVPKDTLMFIDCVKPHETWANPGGFKIIYVHIYNPMLGELCNYLNSLATPVIKMKNDQIGFVRFLKQMHEDIKNNVFNQLEYSKKIYNLLLDLKTFVELSVEKPFSSPDYINKLVEYISQNYQKKLSIEKCAKIVNISPNHLENMFCRYTGVPLAKYISNFRLKKSEYLLINTNKSIYQIARDVGLEDSQSLIRLYKKNFGITPLNFRKQNK